MTTRLKKREHKETMRRRHFFRSFLGETVSAVDQIRGVPQMSLDELDRVPDGIVNKMRPIREPAGPYAIDENRLVVREKDGRIKRVIHILEPWEIDVLEHFTGRSTVEEIALDHAALHAVGRDVAYERVKSLFIALSSYMVCRPADSHQYPR